MTNDVSERLLWSMPSNSLFDDTKAISMPEKRAEKSMTTVSCSISVSIDVYCSTV